ncbi:MAG TPA: tRNA (cytidine(34)-2'-O)-methyltransferase [Rhizomicrobium sp.]|nr:tRNA (cytidine(34)-2'-O)-methyltransferase [Rhizomicrobium sp.]
MPFPAATCAGSATGLKEVRPRLALYQPDIPQNAGSLMRLCACLGVAMDLIEPCGFLLSDRNFRRAGMDYRAGLSLTRHESWEAFRATRQGRLLLLTTKAATAYTGFAFDPSDTILAGRESAGVPDEVHRAADARLLIPMRPGMRSLNVAQAAAMVLGEALRQTALFPRVLGQEAYEAGPCGQ